MKKYILLGRQDNKNYGVFNSKDQAINELIILKEIKKIEVDIFEIQP